MVVFETDVATQPVAQLPTSSGAVVLATAAGAAAESEPELLQDSSSTVAATDKVVPIFLI